MTASVSAMDEQRSRGPAILAAAVAVVLGMLGAVQIRVNGQLGAILDDGYLSALIVFTDRPRDPRRSRCSPRTRRAPDSACCGPRSPRAPPRSGTCFAGAAGAFIVSTQGLTAALLGVAAFTIAMVCGQVVAGLIIDARGLGTMAPRRPESVARIVGAALALVAVALAVSSELAQGSLSVALLLPLLGGAAFGWQQSVNGQVRVRRRISDRGDLGEFRRRHPGARDRRRRQRRPLVGWPDQFPPEPWLYLGGPIGVLIVGHIHDPGSDHRRARAGSRDRCRPAHDVGDPRPASSRWRTTAVTAMTIIGTALTLVAVAISAIRIAPVVQSAVK